jgi:hypothetical protein
MPDSSYTIRDTKTQQDREIKLIDNGDGTYSMSTSGGGGTSVSHVTGLSAGALNADLVPSTDVSAYKSFALQVLGTWVGTLTFQGSNDGTNWVPIPVYETQTNTVGATQSLASNKVMYANITFRYLRVRMTAYTSGTATGVLELSPTPMSYHTMSVLAVQSGTYTVQPGNTQNTTPWYITQSRPSLNSGQTTVTTAGTHIQLPSNACATVTIKAKKANTGLIYVGGSSVTSGNGLILEAGEQITLNITNTNLLYIDSSVSGEGISYIFTN